MHKNIDRAPALAPHVRAALGTAPQAKPAPRGPGAPAAHVQRALQAGLQAKPQAAAGRVSAPHVAAALPRRPQPDRAPAAVQKKPAPLPRVAAPVPGPAPRSLQPCLAGLWSWIKGGCCFGGSSNQNTQNAPLLGSGSGGNSGGNSGGGTTGGSVALTLPKKPTIFLDQGDTGVVAYGGKAANLAPNTSCALVILHTAGPQAVGYHWPFCSGTSGYKGAFDRAIGTRVGTSIDVVVNGAHYPSGDSVPRDFGRYLQREYQVPVAVFRQVMIGEENATVEPFVQVDRGGVVPGSEIHRFVPVAL